MLLPIPSLYSCMDNDAQQLTFLLKLQRDLAIMAFERSYDALCDGPGYGFGQVLTCGVWRGGLLVLERCGDWGGWGPAGDWNLHSSHVIHPSHSRRFGADFALFHPPKENDQLNSKIKISCFVVWLYIGYSVHRKTKHILSGTSIFWNFACIHVSTRCGDVWCTGT